MEVLKALFLALVLMGSEIRSGSVRPAQGQTPGTGRGDVFLDSLEQKVRDIASQALTNVQNAADLVQSCTAGGDCSRAECHPLSTDGAFPSYSCGHYPVQLPFCSNQVPACNSRIWSTSTRGYVRLPVAADDPNRVLCDIRQSICVQRDLDDTFRSASTELSVQYNHSIYFHMFFGSVAGDFRYFPGRDAVNCSLGLYDPRIRPWYSEAISVVKNLVVLIDNGASMSENAGFSNGDSAFAVANNLIEALLRGAVTPGDTISVVGYNSVISFNETLNVKTSTNVSELESFLSKGAALAPVDATSNLTVGLERAQVLLNATDNSDCKIVVLFTHFSANPLQHSEELKDIASRGIKLFLYTLGNTPATQNNSCYYFERLGPLDPAKANLLLKLNGFFSFLARSRNKTGLLEPHWRKFYESSSRIGLGNVITVGMPALDGSGQLVGVAGIDVPLDDLKADGDLDEEVTRALTTRSTEVPRGVSGEDLCQAAPQLNPLVATCASHASLVPKNVVCTATSRYSPQLLCCEGCAGTCGSQCSQASPPTSPGPGTSPNVQSPPGISEPEKSLRGGGDSTPLNIIVPAVVVGGLGVIFAIWLLTKRYFPKGLPPAPQPQPPPSDTPSPPGGSPEEHARRDLRL